ncbi:hypothetical protein C5S32_02660 [ANME-1 cluster archaeon GoMg1]|nr:hypothetical protein [ANME-1 cluster archaeon GoMg1]
MNNHTHKKILLIAIVILLVATVAMSYFGYVEFLTEPHAATPSLSPSPSHEVNPNVNVNVNASAIAPDEVLGMKKVVVSCGDDALQKVKQSHTGSVEHVEDVAIVHYMNMEKGKLLTLWTTRYPNETIANDETEKMVVGMQKWGGSWASDLKELTIAEKTVYQTSSGNVSHYFWADQEWVFYVIPHNFTQDEIAEIIGAISSR